jgi:CRISPR/Cas system CMR subunit Cmr4 (Cas7 group RAMP superfamily)
MIELKVELVSDTTFGRGDGVAGLVDAEVEYDSATGLPFIRGRVLKGLLTEECANILFALKTKRRVLEEAALFLFGESGSTQTGEARMMVGSAVLPDELSQAVGSDVRAKRMTVNKILESLTAIRRQTSIDETSGAPETGSLRSARVVLRETVFSAPLEFTVPPTSTALALLAACAHSVRRGGSGRNRGRGRLRVWLNDDSYTQGQIDLFEKLIREED